VALCDARMVASRVPAPANKMRACRVPLLPLGSPTFQRFYCNHFQSNHSLTSTNPPNQQAQWWCKFCNVQPAIGFWKGGDLQQAAAQQSQQFWQ
jgi:hypothetical protein